MSEAKFTPGPWEVMNGTDVFGVLGGDSGDGMKADELDGWQVADCNVGITYCGGEQMELGGGVRMANARLIAAAPDLLEALMEVVEQTGGYVPDTSKSTWRKVQAAISKALGEPSHG